MDTHELIGQILFATGKFNRIIKKYKFIFENCTINQKEKYIPNIASNLIEIGNVREAKTLFKSR